jgi:hypothetical protein
VFAQIRLHLTALVVVFIALVSGAGTGHAQSAPSGLGLGPVTLLGDEPSYLDLGAGAFNIQDHVKDPSGEGRLEFRFGGKLFYIGPAVGVLANTQGGVFGYAGLYSDLAVGRVVFTPLAAVGGYRRGASEDLGETFQFRLSGAVAYQFDSQARAGIQFAHISNAGIATHNPGDNELLVTYSLPLGWPL